MQFCILYHQVHLLLGHFYLKIQTNKQQAQTTGKNIQEVKLFKIAHAQAYLKINSFYSYTDLASERNIVPSLPHPKARAEITLII